MTLTFPLKVCRFQGVLGQTSAYIIKDATGRQINIACDDDPLRREVAKLWSPEEAEALAKQVARWLTDANASERAIHMRQQEMQDPHSWAYQQQNGKKSR